jgi:syntaxin-binding protein 1
VSRIAPRQPADLIRGANVNVNDLKDMLASLPQFQTQREQFSLHLDMAQECMGLFETRKLNLSANVEQVCHNTRAWLMTVLRYWFHCRGQGAENASRGDGPLAR